MFLTLGLLVNPAELGPIALEGTALAFVLVFVARPLAVIVATRARAAEHVRALVLGWAGLRGAVPVVLALFPILAGVDGAADFFNIAFFAVLVSTLLQGSTFTAIAGALGALTSEPALRRPLVEVGTIRELGADVVEVPLVEGDAVIGVRVRDLGLPRDALVNVLVRNDEALPPRGSTRLEAGDRLYVLVRQTAMGALEEARERWRAGPVGPQPRPERVHRPSGAPIFTTRPWTEADGDPDAPEKVLGLEVIERLGTRWDVPGALVVLADGRYAVTGPHVARRQPRAAAVALAPAPAPGARPTPSARGGRRSSAPRRCRRSAARGRCGRLAPKFRLCDELFATLRSSRRSAPPTRTRRRACRRRTSPSTGRVPARARRSPR